MSDPTDESRAETIGFAVLPSSKITVPVLPQLHHLRLDRRSELRQRVFLPRDVHDMALCALHRASNHGRSSCRA